MSIEHDDKIKAAYDLFWRTRNAVKEQQRRELEEKTRDVRANLAQVIWDARRSPEKYTVQDVADLLGLTNRNFLYKVLNDKPLNDPDTATKPVGRPSAADKDKKPDTEKSKPFHLSVNGWVREGNVVQVRVHNAATNTESPWYFIRLNDVGEVLDIPEDWYIDTLTPDEVDFYKNLIQRIEKEASEQ